MKSKGSRPAAQSHCGVIVFIAAVALLFPGCPAVPGDTPPAVPRDSVLFCAVEGGAGKIKATGLNGGDVRDVLTGLSDKLADIEVDSVNSKIYWVESSPHAASNDPAFIRRADMNGANSETIRETGSSLSIQYIELDVGGGKIFWEEGSGLNGGMFYRASVSGAAPEELTFGTAVYGIALYKSMDRLYFVDLAGPYTGISYFSLADPDNKTSVVSDPVDGGLEIDFSGGKMYWSVLDDTGTIGVHRANCDGTEAESLFALADPDPDRVRGVALYQ